MREKRMDDKMARVKRLIFDKLETFRKSWLRILQRYFCEGVHYINGPETLPAPLTPAEEAEVMRQIEQGKENAREPLITHNLRLVVYIAKKFDSNGANVEDLISIGTIGLIKAVNTFCPERNIKLATYASRCIENEILMFLRKSSQLKNEISIDEPLNVDWDGNELLLSDVLGSDQDTVNRDIEQEVECNLLLQAVSHLQPRERTIMELRFGLAGNKEHTQKEVADNLGISQSYISRLEKRIIERLKKDLERVG
jgi:RNA polymerase sporulation-specific sigma factor